MQKIAIARKNQRDMEGIGRRDDFIVSDRPAWCDNRRASTRNRGFQTVGKRKEPVTGTRGAFGMVAGALRRDLHRAHAVRLPRADATGRSAVNDHDAVAFHVPDDIPSECQVVPLLRAWLSSADDAPLFL